MTEKEKYLKVATPEQWDYWLTLKADANASYLHNDWHVKELHKFEEKHEHLSCLFCVVYKIVTRRKSKYFREEFQMGCVECFGEPGARCLNIPPFERVDKAIERLEKLGIWD